jgi:transcription elongation factor GreA
MATATILTAEGKRELERELRHLQEVKRPEMETQVRQTAESGEFDAAYLDAQYRHGLLNERVERLTRALAGATVVEDHHRPADGSVGLGSRVTVIADDDAEIEYTVVASVEADPAAARISNESPVGRALLGQRAGADITVQTPAGVRRLRIVGVE